MAATPNTVPFAGPVDLESIRQALAAGSGVYLLQYDAATGIFSVVASESGAIITYADAAPLLGATTVQAAIDALKLWCGLPAVVVLDADTDIDANPKPVYVFGPTANRVFDPSKATRACMVTIVKSTTSAFKLTLKAVTAWNYNAAGTNTAFDLPGSDQNDVTKAHKWSLFIDPVAKTVRVDPGA